jgi:hypothetical protein
VDYTCGRWASLFDLQNDSAEDIIEAMLSNISAHKAETIGKGLIAGAKRKRQQPAG